MLKIPRFLLALFIGICLQPCAKDTDLISDYVVLDTVRKEYRSAQHSSELDLKKTETTVALIPFSN